MRVLHSIAHWRHRSGTDALSAIHNLQGRHWLPYERGANISPKDLVQSWGKPNLIQIARGLNHLS